MGKGLVGLLLVTSSFLACGDEKVTSPGVSTAHGGGSGNAHGEGGGPAARGDCMGARAAHPAVAQATAAEETAVPPRGSPITAARRRPSSRRIPAGCRQRRAFRCLGGRGPGHNPALRRLLAFGGQPNPGGAEQHLGGPRRRGLDRRRRRNDSPPARGCVVGRSGARRLHNHRRVGRRAHRHLGSDAPIFVNLVADRARSCTGTAPPGPWRSEPRSSTASPASGAAPERRVGRRQRLRARPGLRVPGHALGRRDLDHVLCVQPRGQPVRVGRIRLAAARRLGRRRRFHLVSGGLLCRLRTHRIRRARSRKPGLGERAVAAVATPRPRCGLGKLGQRRVGRIRDRGRVPGDLPTILHFDGAAWTGLPT